MEIIITLEKDDWKRFQSHIEKELPKSVRFWTDSFLFNFIIGAILVFTITIVIDNFHKFHLPTAVTVGSFSIVFLFLSIINSIKLRIAYSPSKSGIFIGKHYYVFDDYGIMSQGGGYKNRYAWYVIKKIERSNGMIFIYLDTAHALVFPEKKLENPDEFFSYINEQYKNITKRSS